jgi:septal ring factor EnvC (AmiA/AmiB activator)
VNLGTANLIIGSLVGLIAILVYLLKGMQYNKSRNKAHQGRIKALSQVVKYQGKRVTNLETYLAEKDESNYQVNNELIELEEEAMSDFKKNDTLLT